MIWLGRLVSLSVYVCRKKRGWMSGGRELIVMRAFDNSGIAQYKFCNAYERVAGGRATGRPDRSYTTYKRSKRRETGGLCECMYVCMSYVVLALVSQLFSLADDVVDVRKGAQERGSIPHDARCLLAEKTSRTMTNAKSPKGPKRPPPRPWAARHATTSASGSIDRAKAGEDSRGLGPPATRTHFKPSYS